MSHPVESQSHHATGLESSCGPLSYNQQALWFASKLDPIAYNLAYGFRLRGALDPELLKRALSLLVARHPVLRTTFSETEHAPHRVLHDRMDFEFQHVEAAHLDEAAMLQRLYSDAARPYDLQHGPVLRSALYARGPGEHVLLLACHHLSLDGGSLGLLLQDLQRSYSAVASGREADLGPPPTREYDEFVQWQSQWLASAEGARARTWWREQLAGCTPVLNLPTDRPRLARQSFRQHTHVTTLAEPLAQSLAALAKGEGTSLYALLLAAFQALLHRHSGQEDLLVGVPSSGRSEEWHSRVVGYLVNTLAVRSRAPADVSFRSFYKDTARTLREALAHGNYPLPKVIEELKPPRDAGRSPLVQATFTQMPRLRLDASAEPTPFEVDRLTASNVGLAGDLSVHVHATRDSGTQFLWAVNADVFEPATVERLAARYVTLLESLLTGLDQPLAALRLLPREEEHQLVVEWNATATDVESEVCLHEMFSRQVERTPDAVALLFENEALTYRELDARANHVAHRLRRLGVGPEVRVGLCVERSPELIVGLLGVLKAGGAYVPLDPAYPSERLAFMVADARLTALVTQRSLAERLPVSDAARLFIGAGGEDLTGPCDAPDSGVGPGNAAYVIYTSGSTGRPKGVTVEHRSVSNLLATQPRVLPLGPGDTMLQFASVSFDMAVQEIFSPLVSGAALCLARRESLVPGPELASLLRERRISAAVLSPSALAALPSGEYPALKSIMVGGEASPESLVARWSAGRRYFNGYGPTEATIYATYALCTAGAPVTLGRPVGNVRVYLLDARLQPVPRGVAGELYIGGDGVARGYLGRPELTAERFIPDCFSGTFGSRLYRTGDLARHLPDGRLEFLGRVDHQVKLRGFRIELGEIESGLRAHPDVRDVAVLAREEPSGGKFLVAYTVAHEGREPEEAALRAFLKQSLPEYMVPSAFVACERLPLTSNGKVDRAALLAIPVQRTRAPRSRPPTTEAERILARIWQEVLQLERVGATESFFDLGGHSLLLTQVRARVGQAFGREPSMVELFEHVTVESLAAHLSAAPAPELPRRTVLPQTEGEHAVAIIGLAGQFPGAKDLEQFWRNLAGGVESISQLSDDALAEAGVPAALSGRSGYVRAKGVFEGADLFDADFFGVNPREASQMDPQQRRFLECAWEALEDAGYPPQTHDASVGVFATSSATSYQPLPVSSEPADAYQLKLGLESDFLATRVSYKLDLRGPGMTVRTGCSGSLVAVHLACKSVLSGECDLALAGGVSISVPLVGGYVYQPGMILSPDGHCRAFDARAGGTVRGNGVGAVVLKRLDRALADGDTVHAVIRGTALNNDGAGKLGYTAPSITGQAEVIRRAHDAAGVLPHEVSFVETHGTGTPLGDPVEVAALARAFQRGTGLQGACALGATKPNIGHLDSAAGIAGLIKTVLCLRHRQLPPVVHFDQPNPALGLDGTPFSVNARLSDWTPPDGLPRIAGVSSFGIGGTNAHVVVAEAPAIPTVQETEGWRVLPLSARTPAALAATAKRLGEALASRSDVPLSDVAHTLQQGRTAFEQRTALVCRDMPGAVRGLERLTRELAEGERSSSMARDREVVFMFPGQGAQYSGMARGLYAAHTVFRSEVDRCAELLLPHLGQDVRELLLLEDASDERIHQTALAQPCLFVIEYALARLWMSLGVIPKAMVGHSLGEYVAACLAGVFSLEDALGLVCARGRLMQAAPVGAMLAVGLDADALRPLLDEHLSVAVYNAPAQTVVAGSVEAISGLQQRLEARGTVCRRLRTSHAYHSPMMESALEPFDEQVRRIPLAAPSIPIVSNVTGTWMTAARAMDPDSWVQHLRQPVRFTQGLTCLLEGAERLPVEVGPGQSLGGLVRQCPGFGAAHAVLSSLPRPSTGADDAEFFLSQVGEAWSRGATVDWRELTPGERGRRVSLPTYPFERRRYWAEQVGTHAVPSRVPTRQQVEEPEPVLPATASAPLTEADPTHEALTRIWRELLGISEPGRHDDFFDLGGHSLLAVQLGTRIRETFQIDFPQQRVLEHRTIARLGSFIQEATRGAPARDSSLLVELNRGDPRRRPLFLLHPVGGTVFTYQALARMLDPGLPVYGVRARGLEPGEAHAGTIESMAALYLDAVRARQPSGPYLLAGHSFGGVVAYEMAQQLLARHEQVEQLVLMDTPGPGQMPVSLGSPDEIQEYFRRMAPELFRELFLRPTGHEGSLETLLPRSDVFLRVFQENAAAMFAYAPRPYPGRLVFFHARERDATNPPHPELAWIPLATEGVEVHVVPGNHVTMLAEPHVRSLAKKLRGALDDPRESPVHPPVSADARSELARAG
ncbi:non-ribosomal peptide synthetase/type I polyketide synthase [Pyxidicoccus caerfyrddinensis]|uniref:non-ribosomal peptide synthetase/type I polyketide synthase n=1 Tax=Pyxidicoccus caerfyrddinensis TaxID=2709663 RepID=UPI0013D943FF|nr:non-ribosomal peptide synthetase/type I polyketide synthase [Pyxidicoccus caerfyrddinensis]